MHGRCVWSSRRHRRPDLQAVGGPAQGADEEQAEVPQHPVHSLRSRTHRSLSFPPAWVSPASCAVGVQESNGTARPEWLATRALTRGPRGGGCRRNCRIRQCSTPPDRDRIGAVTPLSEVFGESPGIVAVRQQVRRLLERPAAGTRRLPPILILGETGTGKGLLASVIHRAGPRAAGPFIDVNCAAIPETLLEAELFGFERGAFTDARQAKPGLFQAAHRGALFLDEVGLLPESLQAKLLKVLEDRAVRRLGSTRSEAVDLWLVAATSEDLEAAVRARRFRQDLYHRLAVVTLRLPPLRERGGDILGLAEHFLRRACEDYGLPLKTLTGDARKALLAHPWPGHVR